MLDNNKTKKFYWILFFYRSKVHVLSEYKTEKKRVLLFCACKIYILKQMKKPKPCITLW